MTAKPGPVPPEMEWPATEGSDGVDASPDVLSLQVPPEVIGSSVRPSISQRSRDNLTETNLYSDRTALEPRAREEAGHEGVYLMSLITQFGVRPIRTNADYDLVQREQERARRLEEPAMLVGLPLGFDAQARNAGVQWMDDAGITVKNDLAIFDLRMVATERLEPKASI